MTLPNIHGSVVTPASPEYNQAIARPSATCIFHPAYIFYPQVPTDISEILKFVRAHDPPLDVAVKGGAANYMPGLSSCDGGVVIDLARLNHVKVSDDKKTVSVGGGALWGDVYSETEKHNIVVVGANVWSVGVGGGLVGGGYSCLSGRYGLAIDNLLQATVVLADGRIVTCNAEQEPDLFWAIRGAGSQFGVVTEFVLKAHPSPESMLVGVLVYPGSELQGVLKAVQTFLSTQNPTSRIMMCFSRMPPDFQPGIAILPYIEGSPERAEDALFPFRTIVQPVYQLTGPVQSFNTVSHTSDQALSNLPPRIISGTVLYSEFWDDVATNVYNEWKSYTEVEERRATIVLHEFDFRENIAAVSTEATAYPARNPHYYAVITDRHFSPENDQAADDWVSKIISHIKKSEMERTGIDHPTPAFIARGNESVDEVYGKNYPRLRKLKAKYDPGQVWHRGIVIEPDFD